MTGSQDFNQYMCYKEMGFKVGLVVSSLSFACPIANRKKKLAISTGRFANQYKIRVIKEMG